ncbi:lysin B [Gordonia phage Survivors]|uniref:Lysin B n=1 Tax=Gordonia phage Azira TaxID=3035369 RepID=A0AAF0GM13_9CAUD|nr:lysin B [Gordonia phage Azira]UVK59615.1 lysin B [Gordonia phage Survivors]WGH21048.1 lysin B [Gordonia phage Azira]
MKYFLALRGTGEPVGGADNMLHRAYLETQAYMQYADVNYPASIAVANPTRDPFGPALSASIEQGVAVLKATVYNIRQNDPGAVIVVAGYSLGALVLQAALEEGVPINRAIALANPARVSQSVGIVDIGGYTGIASGFQEESSAPVFNVAYPKDGITSLHPASPLRKLVPWVWALDLDDWEPWARYVLEYITGWRWWTPQAMLNRKAWDEAFPSIIGYLIQGDHTTRYFEDHWNWKGRQMTGVQLVAALADEA